ncbi:MAG: hypothetical protein RSE41_09640 [Clostridia bacterium]
MCYECEICKEKFGYRDEVVLLDCIGEDSLDEKYGGSGDIYGIVCTTCYNEHTLRIIESVSKCGIVNIEE